MTLTHTDMNSLSLPSFSQRQAAVVAGVASLLMFVGAMVAELYARQRLIVPGDAALTAQQLLAEPGAFRVGMAGYLLVLVGDLLAALAFYVFFAPVHRHLSLLAAWIRVLYTAVYVVALSKLWTGFALVAGEGVAAGMSQADAQVQALWDFRAFEWGWAFGMVFFALPGRNTDGACFIDEAIMRGAVAIVARHLPAVPPARVTFVQVADVRAALARVAQRFYRFPDRDLAVIGVAGATGKTSVAHLLHHLLNGDGGVGLLGSVSYDLGNRVVPSFRTTPAALDVFGMLAQMREAGCRQAVVEVDDLGLEHQCVRGLQFAAAVHTHGGADAAGAANSSRLATR